MKIGLIAIELEWFLQRLNFRRKAHFYDAISESSRAARSDR